MSYEIKGKVIVINDTIIVSDKFRKKEFVIEKKETSPNGYEFIDTIKFQLTQEKCELINGLKIGDEVNVHFNVKGNKWEKNGNVSYFVNLDAFKVEVLGEVQNNPVTEIPPAEGDDGDVPF